MLGVVKEIWKKDLENALRRARNSGKSSIADYISLKASNDTIRAESVSWLLDTVLNIVFAFNRHGARIQLDKKENHGFEYAGATLTGPRLLLKQGIRCLTIEAGWTRVPGDGIMQNGALAFSSISHFGYPKENEILALHVFEGTPGWYVIEDDRRRTAFSAKSLERHFETFLR